MTASIAPRSSPSSSASTRLRSSWTVVLAEGDGGTTETLDELEHPLAGLFGDDLAEKRAEQPNLERERVACAGRPDARRFRALRARLGRAGSGS